MKSSTAGVRRWRRKRPPILALYLSAPAFTLTALTSYTTFCFLQYLRLSAWGLSESESETGSEGSRSGSEEGERDERRHRMSSSGDYNNNRRHGRGLSSATAVNALLGADKQLNHPLGGGTPRDGLAETCYWLSQNWPTVGLLMPRAGLCLAVLLGYWSVPATDTPTLGLGRDATFFHANGALTDYARGVLAANAAWAAWRALVCLVAWLGLWLLSGAPCAGLCGPRDRWEESALEKSTSGYADDLSDVEPLAVGVARAYSGEGAGCV
ncbi:hypothetical protein R3P38DRAFT_475573 [Favolaschia claudopus]|uniref:Uncharacterized protein n=1 Tax=Favolaschia claudopus TaxID=2862362 RepID=A0AAW0CGX8_9AGAR